MIKISPIFTPTKFFYVLKNYLKRGKFAFSNSFKFLIKIIQIYSNCYHSEIFFKALKIRKK